MQGGARGASHVGLREWPMSVKVTLGTGSLLYSLSLLLTSCMLFCSSSCQGSCWRCSWYDEYAKTLPMEALLWMSFGISLLLMVLGYVASNFFYLRKLQRLSPPTTVPTTAAAPAAKGAAAAAAGTTVASGAVSIPGTSSGSLLHPPSRSSSLSAANSATPLLLLHGSFSAGNRAAGAAAGTAPALTPQASAASASSGGGAGRTVPTHGRRYLPAAAAPVRDAALAESPFALPVERIPSEADFTTTISGISYSSMRRGLSNDLESPFVLGTLPSNSFGVGDDEGDDGDTAPRTGVGSKNNASLATAAAATGTGKGEKECGTPWLLYLEFAAMVGLFMVTTVVVFQCHRYIKIGMLALVTLVFFAVHLSLAWRAVRQKSSTATNNLKSATSAGSNMGLSPQATLSATLPTSP